LGSSPPRLAFDTGAWSNKRWGVPFWGIPKNGGGFIAGIIPHKMDESWGCPHGLETFIEFHTYIVSWIYDR
jgi:hypothetical protein